MKQQVLVTFGVAVYNVSQYLPQCLGSLLTQSGDDVEFLLVDDGSVDGSGDICDQYAQKDLRIRVIHQTNKGISAVRNTIIAHAAGEWISFVDGDDRLLPNAMEQFRAQENSEFDILYFNRLYFRSDRALPSAAPTSRHETLNTPAALGSLALQTMYSTEQESSYGFVALRPVYAKLFRTTFLRENELLFCEALPMGEDVEFNLRCIARAHAVLLCATPVYLYRNNQASAVRRYRQRIVEENTVLARRLSAAAEFFPDLREEMEQRFYMRSIADLVTCLFSGCCHRDNPQPLEVRKEEFLYLLSLPWCKAALDHVPSARLNKRDRALLALIRKKDFRAVCRHFNRRARREALRRLLGNSRLAKRLYLIYTALKRRFKKGSS